MTQSAIDQAAELYRKASNEWGAFRRFLANHPLTCFWLALGGGALLGYFIGRIAG